jgi:hypothetical protein
MAIRIIPSVGKRKIKPAYRRDKNFKRPFVLSRSNMRPFMAKHIFYDGKYVFDLYTKRLVLGETGWRHKDIAGLKFGDSKLEGRCGGFILISKEDNQIIIRFAGKSTHFGQPTRVDLDLLINHTHDLLDVLGLSPYRIRKTDAGTLTIFTNYSDSFSQAYSVLAESREDVAVLQSS